MWSWLYSNYWIQYKWSIKTDRLMNLKELKIILSFKYLLKYNIKEKIWVGNKSKID